MNAHFPSDSAMRAHLAGTRVLSKGYCTMQRPLGSFALPVGLLGKLKSAGFRVSEDLRDLGVVELSKELNIPHSQAAEILKVVNGVSHTPSKSSSALCPHSDINGRPHISTGVSALEMLKAEQLHSYIVTFSAQVDWMLGGGVSVGKITEICGAPGVGKTQFSMQLVVDVRIPELFGGVEGEAIFIDTEGSFVVERLVDIAESAIQHLKGVSEASCDNGMLESVNEFTLETILSGIHYFRCHDYLELVALVNLLSEFVSTHPKVRLVVVDSIASPFRHGFEDMGLRNRVLSGVAQNLIKLATQCNIAVVLTNQMTTRVNRDVRGSTHLVPALGESWGHSCTIRVVLFWKGNERHAMLYKSPNKKESTVPYQVTEDGIRDVPTLSPGNSQDHPAADPALSQLVSISSSQMEDLEMSPGYEFVEELTELPEYGEKCVSGGTETVDLEGVEHSNRNTCLVYSESELTVPANSMHGDHSNGEDLDRGMTSREDTSQSGSGGQAITSRKRPHPDSSEW